MFFSVLFTCFCTGVKSVLYYGTYVLVVFLLKLMMPIEVVHCFIVIIALISLLFTIKEKMKLWAKNV